MEITTILIIRILVNLVTFIGLIWAFIVHLSNPQSKSYGLTLGYFVACLALIYDLITYGILRYLDTWTIVYWLISFGEIARFYGMERKFDELLNLRSSDKMVRYRFDKFKEMPLNIQILKRHGRKITKTLDENGCIILEIIYEEPTAFILEAMDYDFSILIKEGYVDFEVMGRKFALLQPGERRDIKMGQPMKLYIIQPSTLILTLNKR